MTLILSTIIGVLLGVITLQYYMYHPNVKNLSLVKHFIHDWRKTFGLPITGTLIPKPEDFVLAIDLVREELQELEDAYNNGDKVEILDALGDLEFVFQQLKDIHGFNDDLRLETVMEVYDSNMSKLLSLDESTATKDKYEKLNTPVRFESIPDNPKMKVIRVSDNKVLKGIGFREPNFNKIISKYKL